MGLSPCLSAGRIKSGTPLVIIIRGMIGWTDRYQWHMGDCAQERAKPLGAILVTTSQPAALSVGQTFAYSGAVIFEELGKQDKAEWIASALFQLNAGEYPRIKAVSWWNKIYRPDGSRSYFKATVQRAVYRRIGRG